MKTLSLTRARENSDVRRHAIAAAARALIAERGFEGLRTRDIADRVGINVATLHYHVPSKEELLRLAVDRALDALFAVAAETAQLDGRAIDRLEHLVRGSVLVLTERLPFVTLLLRVRGNTKVERAALARRREFDRLVTDLVKQAEAEGDVRPDVDPAVTARLVFGMVNSLVEWYKPRRGSSATEVADAVCKVAFEGLRTGS